MEPAVSIIDIKDEQEDENKRGNDKKEQNSQEIPKAETCCCCIELKRGAKIIGFTQIIFNTIVFFFASFEDFETMKIMLERKNNMADNSSRFYYDTESEGFCGAHVIELEALIMIAIAVRLLIGVFKNKPNLIEQWYHATAELVFLSLILFITRAGIIYFLTKSYNYIFINITEPLYHGAMCYFTWVVYKYYLSITRKHTSDDLSITT
ncbi:uncharacterized protein [Halyomorpha halys]|uniref:uncharacterized protein n=1 Tax=Halyomorpha halys TaxID=286706 RepID=UPI0006D51C2D|nr:uncharacterized protein LOC106687143 [Halyomorpha halys]